MRNILNIFHLKQNWIYYYLITEHIRKKYEEYNNMQYKYEKIDSLNKNKSDSIIYDNNMDKLLINSWSYLKTS